MAIALTIVGGGIAGCLAAWQAAEAGHTVTLYEPHGLGRAASGQALGLLVPSTGLKPLDDLQRQGCALWHTTLAPRLAELSNTPLPQFFRQWPSGGQLNLEVLFQVFATVFAQMNVTVLTKTYTGTPNLWAAGWGNRHVLPTLTLRPGVACRLTECGLTDILIGKTETQGLYAVPAWDGTTLLGTQKCPEGTEGLPPPDLMNELLRRAALLDARLGQAQVLQAWVGLRPTSSPRLPLLRPMGPQQWAVAGLGGMGYALAPLAVADWLRQLQA